jgi:RNA polymerase sigma factor (sigma-70 family)
VGGGLVNDGASGGAGTGGTVIVEVGTATATDFARWYAMTADGVTRRVSAAVGDPLLGREAAAEAYARAYERWPRVATMESPEGWVFQVAVNICRRGWRQRALEDRALARIVPDLPEIVHGVPHHPDDLYRAVRKLPRRMRVALRLKYWEDLTEQDVAARMGVSPGTASSLLSTARARLRRALANGAGR